MRYVLDLDGYGRIFKMNLNNLGISSQRVYNHSGSKSDIDFVYNESTSQILLAYDPNPAMFLVKLNQLPDIKFFGHIANFNNPQFVAVFTTYFREFALTLLFQIQRILGIKLNVDYLLDAVTDDYIVIFEDIKRI